MASIPQQSARALNRRWKYCQYIFTFLFRFSVRMLVAMSFFNTLNAQLQVVRVHLSSCRGFCPTPVEVHPMQFFGTLKKRCPRDNTNLHILNAFSTLLIAPLAYAEYDMLSPMRHLTPHYCHDAFGEVYFTHSSRIHCSSNFTSALYNIPNNNTNRMKVQREYTKILK